MKNLIELDFSPLNKFQALAANKKSITETINHLSTKDKVLLICTSNRWEGDKYEAPKSTQLANYVKSNLKNSSILDISKLHIDICEGNVSTNLGNRCGLKDAALKDKDKNPTGNHRCWASLNNANDELWKVSKPLFESDAVVFFTSIRWGQTNSLYQKLIERLCWIENRHSTLGEDNIVKNIEAGMIAIGQNWNGEVVVETQKKVLAFYGFKIPEKLSWNWQYTQDALDESQESYKKASLEFKKNFLP